MEIFKTEPPMDLDKSCNMKGCDKPAAWQVSLNLYHPSRRDAPLMIKFGLVICEDHGETAQVKDFLSDSGWAGLLDAIKKMGKLEPDRSLTKLNLLPILKLP